jgi:hypothetical protein
MAGLKKNGHGASATCFEWVQKARIVENVTFLSKVANIIFCKTDTWKNSCTLLY